MKGAQARFDRENAKGGVFGRKIKFVDTADDKFDPTTNVQEARRVVSSGRRLRDRADGDGGARLASDYLAQQKVPFFGWGISSGFCENDYGYGFTGCVAPKTPEYGNTFMPAAGAKALEKDPKGLTVAIIAEDTDAARSGLGTLGTAAESLGMKVVYSKGVVPAPPATVGDFTPVLAGHHDEQRRRHRPTSSSSCSPASRRRSDLQGALQAAGFKGPIENTQTYDPQLAGAVQGRQRLRAVRRVRDRGHGPGRQADDGRPREGGRHRSVCCRAVGYLSADMFIAALKKTGKNLTVDAFQKAASKLKYNVAKHGRSHVVPEGPRAARRVRDARHLERHGLRRHRAVLLRRGGAGVKASDVTRSVLVAPAQRGAGRDRAVSTTVSRLRGVVVDKFLNLLFSGAVSGGIYAVMAAGVVLTYQTSGIFNFAHGAVAFVTAYFFFQLNTGQTSPVVPAALISVLVFAPLLGLALDRILLRRLATAPVYAAHRRHDRPAHRAARARALARRGTRQHRARPRPARHHRDGQRAGAVRGIGPYPA